MQAMPKDELKSRQQHATQLAAKIESVGYARHLDDCKLHCRLIFKPGFEVGIYTQPTVVFLSKKYTWSAAL